MHHLAGEDAAARVVRPGTIGGFTLIALLPLCLYHVVLADFLLFRAEVPAAATSADEAEAVELMQRATAVYLYLDPRVMPSLTPILLRAIARGARVLVETIQSSAAGPDWGTPQVLLVSPAPLARLDILADIFHGSAEKSKGLAARYAEVARDTGCHFFDAGGVIVSSDVDGIHLDLDQHAKLGAALAVEVQRILSA